MITGRMLKRLIAPLKRMLPQSVVDRVRNRTRQARFSGMSPKDAFDKIYRDGYWGHDADGSPISGTGSHDGRIVEPYVAALRDLLEVEAQPSVVDLGCGDFNVGNQLFDLTSQYLACDISETIIAINRDKFARDGLKFQSLDLTSDTLPPADFCMVRQVLQHLSNVDILSFIDKLHKSNPYRFLVVTEHVALAMVDQPNTDKQTGPGVRVEKHSGVDLAAAPFSLKHIERREILAIREDNGNVPAQILTTVYRLK